MADTAVFDIDGTLVDTNYHHTICWYRAFRRFDVPQPTWRIHRAIGMGGDLLVPHVAGQEVEERLGQQIRDAWTEEFDAMLGEVRAFPEARPTLEEVKERGFTLVLASSGKAKHVDAFLDLFDGRSIADGWTTSDDVEESKPEPDLLGVSMRKVGGTSGVLVGDTTWDCEAAGKIDMPVLAVGSGGFSAAELTEAGAARVFSSLEELRARLDDTPLASPSA